MIVRNLERSIRKYVREYPVLAIVGPRQSGKTTLVKAIFPDYRYVTLESLDIRHYAEDDPRSFLAEFAPPVIFDEIQRVPGLLSYLQEIVDSLQQPGQFILTGSNQFLLMEQVTQSLAGRIITFHLFPFTLNELYRTRADVSLEQIFTVNDAPLPDDFPPDLFTLMFTGGYPPIHDRKLDARKWDENYIMTYVERDVRSLLNITNLRLFENFLTMCASRSGQLLNYASLANELGLSEPTIKSWLGLLETSGIVTLLRPYYRNYSKRIVKTPKLYFLDTGLLCYLLSIRNQQELQHHPLCGSIFETFVISEYYKRINHVGERPPLFFWRDQTGNEVDLLVDYGTTVLPIEIKLARTYSTSLRTGLEKFIAITQQSVTRGLVVYTGEHIVGRESPIGIIPWWRL